MLGLQHQTELELPTAGDPGDTILAENITHTDEAYLNVEVRDNLDDYEVDPLTWAEACASPYADDWHHGFQEELDSL